MSRPQPATLTWDPRPSRVRQTKQPKGQRCEVGTAASRGTWVQQAAGHPVPPQQWAGGVLGSPTLAVWRKRTQGRALFDLSAFLSVPSRRLRVQAFVPFYSLNGPVADLDLVRPAVVWPARKDLNSQGRGAKDRIASTMPALRCPCPGAG